MEEHELREERFAQEKGKKTKKKTKTMIIVGIGIFLLVALIAYAWSTPGKYDDFAKCLTSKGVWMQGEDWCKYTQAQKGMFGKSFKYINYQKNPNLNVRPTWLINGKTYERVQSFERLSELTGCKF